MYNYLEEIAIKLLNLFIDNGIWFDTRIYLLNKAYCSNDYDGSHTYGFIHFSGQNHGVVYVIKNISPHDYCKYCGDLLTITSEVNFNSYFTADWLLEEMDNIVSPYGLYFEFGNHWNITLHPI